MTHDAAYTAILEQIINNSEYTVVPYVINAEQRKALLNYDVSRFIKEFKKGAAGVLSYISQYNLEIILQDLHPELMAVLLRHTDDSILFPCGSGYEFRIVIVNTKEKLLSPIYYYAVPNTMVAEAIYNKLPRAFVKAWARATGLALELYCDSDLLDEGEESNSVTENPTLRASLIKTYKDFVKASADKQLALPDHLKIDPATVSINTLEKACHELVTLFKNAASAKNSIKK